MADGKVTIAVDLDGKKAQGDINSLKSSLGGLGSAFKSVLGANLVSGALMSGISALTGGSKSAFHRQLMRGQNYNNLSVVLRHFLKTQLVLLNSMLMMLLEQLEYQLMSTWKM